MTQVSQKRIQQVCDRLKKVGHRITPQRLIIVRALLEQGHPSAEEIHLRVLVDSPTTSLGTVYKTLDTLKELGELQELAVGAGRRHYDGLTPQPHSHVICTKCGRIEDVGLEGIGVFIKQVESQSGFELEVPRLEFFGTCSICR